MPRSDRQIDDLLREARLMAGRPAVNDVLKMTPDEIFGFFQQPHVVVTDEAVLGAMAARLTDAQLISLVQGTDPEARTAFFKEHGRDANGRPLLARRER